MELQEMKTLWEEMSQKYDRQKILNERLITEITRERYKSRFSKTFMYESFGAVICFASAIFLFLNFTKLDTWYLILEGTITLILLLVLPIIVLKPIRNITHLDISKDRFSEVLVEFHRFKKELFIKQELNIYLSYILALIILPVISKILNDKNLFSPEYSTQLWFYIPMLLISFFFFSRWGLNSYKSLTQSAESILKELDAQD